MAKANASTGACEGRASTVTQILQGFYEWQKRAAAVTEEQLREGRKTSFLLESQREVEHKAYPTD